MKRIILALLFAFVGLTNNSLAQTNNQNQTRNQVNITQVEVEYDPIAPRTFKIFGTNFGTTMPVVTLGSAKLEVSSQTTSSIVAIVPSSSAISPGSYLLKVSYGTPSSDNDQFAVTLGVKGPQGLQGEKGEKGDTGAQGLQGERGLQGEQGVPGAAGQSGNSFVVVDSEGKEVGIVVGEPSQESVAVMRQINSVWYRFYVHPSKFAQNGLFAGMRTYYESVNCTGTPYLQTPSSSEFVRFAYSNGQKLYAPVGDAIQKEIRSTKTNGQCGPVAPPPPFFVDSNGNLIPIVPPTFRLLQEIDMSEFVLPLKFRQKE